MARSGEFIVHGIRKTLRERLFLKLLLVWWEFLRVERVTILVDRGVGVLRDDGGGLGRKGLLRGARDGEDGGGVAGARAVE